MATKTNTARRTFKNSVAANITAPNTMITMTVAEYEALKAGSKTPATKPATKAKAPVPAPVVQLPTSKPVASATPASKPSTSFTWATYQAATGCSRDVLVAAHKLGREAQKTSKAVGYKAAFNGHLASVKLPAYYA